MREVGSLLAAMARTVIEEVRVQFRYKIGDGGELRTHSEKKFRKLKAVYGLLFMKLGWQERSCLTRALTS